MPEPRRMRAIAAVVLVLAVPFAVASVIGETTIANVDPKYVDYVVRPPDIPVAGEVVIGALSAVLVVAATAALAWSWKRDPPDAGFLSVLLPLVVVGVILGVAWRVMTAAVIGANIGATLLVLFGSPVILALLTLAGVSTWLRR
ncbi:MAG TPA: hypothetical protein VGR26_05245 [Acidimicrobiales bacterium]|nr:hypothetical protein [Acidimicrobiales bacterium]